MYLHIYVDMCIRSCRVKAQYMGGDTRNAVL